MDILVGIIMVVLGLVVCFSGLRVFAIALPILGFMAGMSLGLEIIHQFWDAGFLSTSVGIVVGLVIGVIFALLSYMFWYIAVIMGAAMVGATVGAGFMNLINVNTNWLIAIVAIAGAIVLGLLTVVLDLPLYWALVLTAFGGASWAVAGVMLVFNRIDRIDLQYGTAWAAVSENWFWLIVWAVVAALGIGSQLTKLAEALLPETKWEKLPPPQTQMQM